MLSGGSRWTDWSNLKCLGMMGIFQMMNYYYCFDGDRIGESVQTYLMNNNLDEAIVFSNGVEKTIEQIVDIMESEGADCVFTGGDSMIFSSEEEIPNEKIPFKLNGLSFSVGVSSNLELATLALFRAKSLGRCQISRIKK